MWATYGCSRWTVLPAIGLQISSRSKSVVSLSPDGKSLAVLRGHYDSDVVLLQESNP